MKNNTNIMTKWFLSRSVAVFVVTAVIMTAPGTAAAAINLIQNAGVETVNPSDSTLPTGWQKGYAPVETASTYTYPTTGTEGAKAVRAEIDNATYVSGDAKWLFDDVAVDAGKKYIYSDYFKSNTTNNLLVRFNGGTNCPVTGCYMEIGSTASQASWTHFQALFTVPADVTTLTVLRIIKGDGGSADATAWLELDDVQLVEDTAAVISNGIPNPSVEEVSYTGLPKEWIQSGYGSNTRTFDYVDGDAHDGQKSVKVTVSNYVDGDAKWMYTPQPLDAGKDYHFSGWYKSNAIPHVVAQYTKTNGDIAYFGMPRPEPTGGSEWQHYENEFSVPENVATVSVFFFLADNGWLQTDDFKITPYEYVGFNRPIVTLTFDDGFEENITTALPVLEGYGLKTTQCYDTSSLEGNPAQVALIQQFIDAGHEICSHTATHANLTTLPVGTETQPGTLRYELKHSRDYLETLPGVDTVPNFASPFGAYNAQVNDVIREYYSSHRTVDEGYNSKDNLNIYRLKVQNISTAVTLADFKEWVKKAEDENLWLILVYHKVVNSGPMEQFDISKSLFDQQMHWLASSSVAVRTYAEALAEVQDSASPVVTLTYSTTSPTNADVVVTAATNEGTLNATTHTFTANGSFDFVATDIAGNVTTKTATVSNIDKDVPEITLLGSNPQAVELGDSYIEQGATATDTTQGNLSSSVVVNSSAVNTNVAGVYTVTYNVVDAVGNNAVTKTRTVQVAGRTITVTADAKTKVIGEVDPAFTYSVTDGSLLPTHSFIGTLSRTGGETVGTYPITIGTLGVNASYAINFIGSSLTIVPPTCSSDMELQDNVCVKKKSSGGGGGSKKKRVPTKVATTTPTVIITTIPGQVLGATTTASTTQKYIFSVNLKIGLWGNDVTELQKILMREGVYGGPVTGYFGPLTQGAVIRFQAKYGLPQTGLVGPLTRAVLNK